MDGDTPGGQPAHDRHGPAGKGLPPARAAGDGGLSDRCGYGPPRKRLRYGGGAHHRDGRSLDGGISGGGHWHRAGHFPAGEGPEKGQREKTAQQRGLLPGSAQRRGPECFLRSGQRSGIVHPGALYGGPAAAFGHAGQSGTGSGRSGPDLFAAFAGASRRGCL